MQFPRKRFVIPGIGAAIAPLLAWPLLDSGSGTDPILQEIELAMEDAPPPSMTFERFLGAIRSGELPPHLIRAPLIEDPMSFFEQEHREAGAVLSIWISLSYHQKLEVLWAIAKSDNPAFIPIMSEIIYFTIPSERHEAIAQAMRSAAMCISNSLLPVSMALVDHVRQYTIVPAVRAHAERDLQGLEYRLRTYGR